MCFGRHDVAMSQFSSAQKCARSALPQYKAWIHFPAHRCIHLYAGYGLFCEIVAGLISRTRALIMQGAFSGGENGKLVGIVRRRCNFHACVDSKRKQLYPRLWLDGYGCADTRSPDRVSGCGHVPVLHSDRIALVRLVRREMEITAAWFGGCHAAMVFVQAISGAKW